MSKKRMSSTQITDSDEFISLTSQQQALYWRLNSHADDDGFNNQSKMDIYMAHATEEDLDVLIEKKFVFKFDGVVCVKHFKVANKIRRERYTPTVYQEYLDKLYVKDNGAYTLSKDEEGVKKALEPEVVEPKEIKEYATLKPELVDALMEFEKMRNKIKKPLTNRARKMILNKLEKLSKGNESIAIEILNQSIVHCWQDVYELKEKKGGASVKDILDL